MCGVNDANIKLTDSLIYIFRISVSPELRKDEIIRFRAGPIVNRATTPKRFLGKLTVGVQVIVVYCVLVFLCILLTRTKPLRMPFTHPSPLN